MTTYCATHRGTETALRCGKCDKLICPKCVVFTPVGTRCRGCARLSRIPTYQVSILYLLRAAGSGFATGIGTGVLVGYLLRSGTLSPAWLFGPLALAACGYLVGEAVSLATNRKRGGALQAVGILAFLAAYLTLEVLTPWSLIANLWSIAAAVVGVAVIVGRLR